MPRQTIPVTDISRAGIALPAEVTAVPADDHEMANDGLTFLVIRNNNGSTAAVATFPIPVTVDGQQVPARTVSVPASATRYVGPFPPGSYGGTLQIDVTTADLRFAALRLA